MFCKNKMTPLALILSALTLAACGGGGGGGGSTGSGEESAPRSGTEETVNRDRPSTAQSPAAGMWTGWNNASRRIETFVLEDGSMWSWEGEETTAGGYTIQKVITSTLNTTGSTIQSNDLRVYDINLDMLDTGSVEGSFQAGSQMDMSLRAFYLNSTYTVYPITNASFYNYDTPATVAAISGNWHGGFNRNGNFVLSVDSNGGFDTLTDKNCRVSGSFLPRASGKNVYDVKVTFGPAPCDTPNSTSRGHAWVVSPNTPQEELGGMVVADEADPTKALVYLGLRTAPTP